MAVLSQKKHRQLSETLDQLVIEGVLPASEASHITGSITVVGFDWRRLARYGLVLGVLCIIAGILLAFGDPRVIVMILAVFSSADWVKVAFCAGASTLLFFNGALRRQRKPSRVLTNEAMIFLGVLFAAAAIYWLHRPLGLTTAQSSWLLLAAAVLYGALGVWLQSKLTWAFALLSLGAWMGAETGYMSGFGAYWFGLGYPLRFVLFGLVLSASAFSMRRNARLKPLYPTSRNLGLLYLFVSLWILSIFGNYSDLSAWSRVKQIELFHWSLIFALASGGAIWLGLKWSDRAYRGFGLTFLAINLYTRFFEFFWDPLHKALFFALLGISLCLLGRWAEKQWIRSSSSNPLTQR